MATNRILEFTPSQEEAIVARVLVLVHQAVDEHFPSAEKATRQFTKTVFSDDGENTKVGPIDPNADTDPRGKPVAALAGAFGNEEKTGPGREPAEAAASAAGLPPPPQTVGSKGASHASSAPRAPAPPPPLPAQDPGIIGRKSTAPTPQRPNPNISRHDSRHESRQNEAGGRGGDGHSGLGAVSGMSASGVSGISGMSGMTGLKGGALDAGPDWVTRITLVLLVAGLVLLAYSLLA